MTDPVVAAYTLFAGSAELGGLLHKSFELGKRDDPEFPFNR